MAVLRPKYVLDGAQTQGAISTIPAGQYVQLTSQRYPYPRLGTRAAHYTMGNGHVLMPHYTMSDGHVLEPHYTLADGQTLKPHYTLDSMEVQGVMPAETYFALTGKLTTGEGPSIPRQAMSQVLVQTTEPASLSYPVSLQWEWAVGGFILGLLTGWGLTQALIEAAKRRVGRWK